MLNQGPHSKFLSGGGGGGGRLFLAPIFLLNYFLFNLFLFLQGRPPPSPSLCAVPVNALKGQRVESIVSEKLVKM